MSQNRTLLMMAYNDIVEKISHEQKYNAHEWKKNLKLGN